jgi:hypothetical protein
MDVNNSMISQTDLADWPWEVRFRFCDMLEMLEIDSWCINTFGPRNQLWRTIDHGWQMRLHEDAALLNMTWGYYS